jgi:hypothetical protein
MTKDRKTLFVLFINSLAYYMLAYFTIVILTNLFSILLAKTEGVSGVLRYYGFEVFNAQTTWSKELIFLVFFIGIGFSFALAVLFERIYKRIRRHTYHLKLYFQWGYFLGFIYFFGNLLIGAFFYFGTGVVFESFSIPMLFRILLGVASLIPLAYTGIYATRGFIISLNAYFTFVDRQEFGKYLRAIVLYPFIAGNILAFAIKIPHHLDLNFLDTLIWLTGIIPVAALLLSFKTHSSIRFKRRNKNVRFFMIPLILFVVILLIYRIGLIQGIVF